MQSDPTFSLNISKAIVCCPALNKQSCEHILEFMREQGVTYVCRISVFGHHENKCGRQALCVKCSMTQHCPVGQRQRPAKCVNCSGDHPVNSKQRTAWEKEMKILKIKCEQNISFPEARKQYEQFYNTRTYASAVKHSTCSKFT